MAITQCKELSLNKLEINQPKDFVNYISIPRLSPFNLLSMHSIKSDMMMRCATSILLSVLQATLFRHNADKF